MPAIDTPAVINEIAADGVVGADVAPVALNIRLQPPAAAAREYREHNGWVVVKNDAPYKEILAVALAAVALERNVSVRANYVNNRMEISALRLINGP
jgi:hypothetical protein